MLCTLKDHAGCRFPYNGSAGSQLGRSRRSRSVQQRTVRSVRVENLFDFAVQIARVLQLVRGDKNTETPVRNEHNRQNQLHQLVRRGQHGGKYCICAECAEWPRRLAIGSLNFCTPVFFVGLRRVFRHGSGRGRNVKVIRTALVPGASEKRLHGSREKRAVFNQPTGKVTASKREGRPGEGV